jgi:hypothetical protein
MWRRPRAPDLPAGGPNPLNPPVGGPDPPAGQPPAPEEMGWRGEEGRGRWGEREETAGDAF